MITEEIQVEICTRGDGLVSVLLTHVPTGMTARSEGWGLARQRAIALELLMDNLSLIKR